MKAVENMTDIELFERNVKALQIRLKEKFELVSEVAQFDSELFRKLFNENIDKSPVKVDLDELSDSEVFTALRLETFSDQLIVVNWRWSLLSFKASKISFSENFSDFYYPGDDLLVLDGSNGKVVCWIDHEEFAVLPLEPSAG
jgi:hypothetical protein